MDTTLGLLLKQYGRAFISLEQARLDFFPHLSSETIRQRARDGSLGLPVTRFDASQKSAMGIHVEDLAKYLDARRRLAMTMPVDA
jgi:hypothetical protein